MRDQLVAVKVFKVDAPPEQAEQIAEALQAVVQALPRHPGLVEFIAAGVERDTAYLVMAHSDVPSLDSRLKKPGASGDSSTPPVDAEQALVIVRTLAEAMDAAHARGIVHGGLHPRDIFVDERGACRAAGFGVATSLERAGVKVPVRRPYSPPERLTSAPIEPTADRFALGAIAFELLTGRRIAGTGSAAAARCTVSVPGANLDAVRNALAAMLAEQPAHRPSTASAFAQALSLALFPQGVARASAAAGTGATTGADRSPGAAARDNRRDQRDLRDQRDQRDLRDERDANTAAGLGVGIGAGAIAAGASKGSRDNEGDGPSPDDLELFTRQGLFSGQPRQNTLRWEPVEVENVIAPDEDPLELFAPESPAESHAAPVAPATSGPPGTPGLDGTLVTSATPATADAAAGSATTPVEAASSAGADAAASSAGAAAGDAASNASGAASDAAPSAAADANAAFAPTDVDAPEREPEADISEVQATRRDSILGLATTIVAPREREATPPASDADADEGHETTALPFVPIKADERISPQLSRLPDSVLIDDNSRLDALDRLHREDPHAHHDHDDHHDRFEHDSFNHAGRVDDVDGVDGVDGVDLDRVDEDEADKSITPAAAATAGVIAAAGVTSPADYAHSHASHASHASHESHASYASHGSHPPHASSLRGDHDDADYADVDRSQVDHSHVDRSHVDGSHVDRSQVNGPYVDVEASHADRTHTRLDRETTEQWIAPPTEPVTRSSSTLMEPQDAPDVGSSVRVVGLVLALGLAVGGAGGYLLGQRSALRNGSAFDQIAGTEGVVRPGAEGDRAAAQGSGDAPASGDAAGARDAAGTPGPASSGRSGAGRGTPAGTPGGAGTGASANASTSAAGRNPAGGGSAATNTASGAASAAGASRPTTPTTPATAAIGRLTINSTPARADVAIDGVRRGVTPLTLRDLPAGSHTVRVTRGGYAPETRRVTVTTGRPAESITFELEPTAPRTRPSASGAGTGPGAGSGPGPGVGSGPAATGAGPAAPARPERGSASGLGALYIVSRPMGARVTIDGRPVGVTPLLLTDVASGAHTIVLEADGHKPWQTTVQVKMGERTRVAGSLEEGR